MEFYAKLSGLSVKSEHNFGIKQAPDVLFHVCRESRQVAEERYSLQISMSRLGLANTRIDPREEVLCYTPNLLYASVRDITMLKDPIWSQEVLQLERVAIHGDCANDASIQDLLLKFKVLGEIAIVVDRPIPESDAIKGKYLVMTPSKDPYSGLAVRKFDRWWRNYSSSVAGSKKPTIKVMELVLSKDVN